MSFKKCCVVVSYKQLTSVFQELYIIDSAGKQTLVEVCERMVSDFLESDEMRSPSKIPHPSTVSNHWSRICVATGEALGSWVCNCTHFSSDYPCVMHNLHLTFTVGGAVLVLPDFWPDQRAFFCQLQLLDGKSCCSLPGSPHSRWHFKKL